MMWKGLTELEYNTKITGDFPGGPVVKNPPCNAGDMGSIPGGGTRIPHAMGQPASHNKRLHMPNATK